MYTCLSGIKMFVDLKETNVPVGKLPGRVLGFDVKRVAHVGIRFPSIVIFKYNGS